jgi:predicted secreted protein
MNENSKEFPMNRPVPVMLFLIMIVTIFGGCMQQTPQIKEYISASQKIEVEARGQFTIVLESNQTTGYKWEPSFDSSLLKVTKSDYKVSEAKPGMVGVGGKEYFTFEAMRKGETKVTMTYKRPWETGSADQKVFNVSIK